VLDPIEVNTGSDRLDSTSTPEFVDFGASCSDGVDNDRDGRIDGADTGCVDSDSDGLPDHLDNCPAVANFGWSDIDGDGLGDVCDSDIDGDGVSNAREEEFGSDPYEAGSVPEAREVPGTCTDGIDNDRDGLTDGQDLRCPSDVAGVISNGLVQLGINPEGQLNVPGGSPSSGTGTTFVGLRYVPTNAEATAPGCLCEGWGVADATSGVSGYANVAVDGVVNLDFKGFFRTASSAVSVVQVGSTFRVTHDYHPSASPNLYEATVTIQNTSDHDTDVRYRRVMDWDVEPTAFNEFVSVVTIAGAERAKNVLFSSDDGFASANPLSGPSSIDFVGDAIDSGPDDHGALFDFGFGTLKPGEKVAFNIYYGAAATEPEANAALGAVRAEVYSYGQPNCPSFRCPDVNGPRDGKPNTFIFAFSKVGGAPVQPPDTDADGVLNELDNCPFTANANQADSNLDGIGDACSTPTLEHTTAGFLQAGLDGTTTVEPASVLLGDEPSLTDRLVRIVRFRLDAGLATEAAALSRNLVDSLVEAGLVQPGGADALVADVIAHLDRTPPVVKVTFPAADGKNGWFVHSPVTGAVTADDPSKVAGIVCTGATVGTVAGLGTASASAPLTVSGDGTHDVSCTATDSVGNAGTGPGSIATATIKIDATAPTVTCSASPSSLWPPNHKLVQVTTTVSVDGGVSGSAGATLTKATSSEPDKGLGDGDTANDLQDWQIGTADTRGSLRAERSGTGPGRTYTLTYTGADRAGNTATCATLVKVPHDLGD